MTHFCTLKTVMFPSRKQKNAFLQDTRKTTMSRNEFKMAAEKSRQTPGVGIKSNQSEKGAGPASQEQLYRP